MIFAGHKVHHVVPIEIDGQRSTFFAMVTWTELHWRWWPPWPKEVRCECEYRTNWNGISWWKWPEGIEIDGDLRSSLEREFRRMEFFNMQRKEYPPP